MSDRRTFLFHFAAAGTALALPGAVGRLGAVRSAKPKEMLIRKNPGCQCCSRWAAHLEEGGIGTVIEEDPNLADFKEEMGVPQELSSCHTGTIEGYVVEGHVPAEDVLQMLGTRPDIRGLALPGMPIGSPGMEMGDRVDAYDVIAFGGAGDPYVFASHG